MTDIREFLDKYVNEDMVRILVSNARSTSPATKLQVRPVPVKGRSATRLPVFRGQKQSTITMKKKN